eukprot:gene4196-5730_t
MHHRALLAATAVLAMPAIAHAQSAADKAADERPATITVATPGWNYERRAVDIAMRDGVKLHTVILIPKGAHDAPVIFTRTPYNAEGLTANQHSGDLGSILDGYDNAYGVTLNGVECDAVHREAVPLYAVQRNAIVLDGRGVLHARDTAVQGTTASLTISPLGFISGRVFKDNNLTPNGTFEQGVDNPISGVTITLTGTDFGANGVAGGGDDVAVNRSTTTDSLGNYAFTGLNAGSYTVTEPAQPTGTTNGNRQ